MATIEELLEAAANADAAGDAGAAQMLVREAEKLMGAMAGPVTDAATGQAMATRPPRADAPGYLDATPKRPEVFGDTIAKITAGPLAATKAYAGGLVDQRNSPTMAALPQGMPRAVKPLVAAVGDAGMTALAGAGTAIAGAAGLIGEVAGGNRTGERKLARDMLAMSQVAVPELAGVSSTTRMVAGAAKVRAPTIKQEAARAASDLGITPSLGMTGKGGAMASAVLEKFPGTGTVAAKDAARAVTEIETAFQASRAKVGTALPSDVAGQRLQDGLRASVDSFKARAETLFNKVDARMPKGTKVSIDATQSAIAETKTHFAENPALAAKLGLNQWDSVMVEAAKNGMTWQGIKQLRSKVGEAIGSNRGALADEDLGRLKTMYAALTADMEAATKAAGNGAYGAWASANNYYRNGASRIERSLDKTISAENPERAFEAFAAITKRDRASSDLVRMREIRAALDDQTWGDVSASIVDRLGRSKAGAQNAAGDAFSPSTFLTEWNNLSPEARRILLPEDARIELEKLAKVAERAKSANVERNFSNTGTVVAASAMGASLVSAPIATLVTAGGVNVGARAMTYPPFLRALNRAARGDNREISALARGKGPFAADAQTVMGLMAAETANSPANGQEPPLKIAN